MKTKQANDLQYEIRAIDTIIPYLNNPRTIDQAAVDKVKASIKSFSFINPIVVDSDGVILAGHTRFRAAVELSLGEVPVIVAANLSEAKARGYRIADNKTAQFSAWNIDALSIEIGELDALDDLDFNLEATGFSQDELDKMLDGIVDEESPSDSQSSSIDDKKKVTFNLVPEQLDVLKQALGASIELGVFVEPVNDDENANALTRICETFIRVANENAKHYK